MRIEDKEDCDELKGWFDEIWADTDHVKDVKQKVIDALNRARKRPRTRVYLLQDPLRDVP